MPIACSLFNLPVANILRNLGDIDHEPRTTARTPMSRYPHHLVAHTKAVFVLQAAPHLHQSRFVSLARLSIQICGTAAFSNTFCIRYTMVTALTRVSTASFCGGGLHGTIYLLVSV